MFNILEIPVSEWPRDVIPKEAVLVCETDIYDGVSCTVKGFYDKQTGILHVQEFDQVITG